VQGGHNIQGQHWYHPVSLQWVLGIFISHPPLAGPDLVYSQWNWNILALILESSPFLLHGYHARTLNLKPNTATWHCILIQEITWQVAYHKYNSSSNMGLESYDWVDS
jgi:hypothetical protein